MSRYPLIWILLGKRAGDNDQLLTVAEALGWPVVTFECTFRHRGKWPWIPGYEYCALPRILSPECREQLIGQAKLRPPDLVLSAGWRTVPVARWLRDHYGSRLIHIGRPRARLNQFDLVFTSPQYSMPDFGPVRVLPGPPVRPTIRTTQHQSALFSDNQRPVYALLAGGDTLEFQIDKAAAHELGTRAVALCTAHNASLAVLTSPRTSGDAAKILMQTTQSVSVLQHIWARDTENPYAKTLEQSDGFIVTRDSVSMLNEAMATGKPVWVYKTPEQKPLHLRLWRRADSYLKSSECPGFLRGIYYSAIAQGLLYPPRNVSALSQELLRRGLISQLSNPAQEQLETSNSPSDSALDLCVREIRRLMSTPDIKISVIDNHT